MSVARSGPGLAVGRIRVGVIGCGAIAQIMHLPHLHELEDRFQLVALCDADARTLALVADHYHVARRHSDYRRLLEEPLDAVMVLSSGDHTEVVLAALDSGRHVFCEKPLAYTLAETDEILEAARRRDRVLMVGMMKRYDPGYLRGAAAVRQLRDLRWVDARVLHPEGDLYWAHHRILRGTPTPPSWASEPLFGPAYIERFQTTTLAREPVELLAEAVGSTRTEVLTAFWVLIVSSIHDIDALRGILGEPNRVVNAHLWAGGTSFTATLAFPDEVRATYTWTLLPHLKNYDQTYSFYAYDGRVHIRFPSPYLRNEPALVEIESGDGEELRVTRVTASYEEAFKQELLHFHECVAEGRAPLTDGAGFRADLAILTEIGRTLAFAGGDDAHGRSPAAR